MTTRTPDRQPPRQRSVPPPVNCTCPPSAPSRPGWPRSPCGNARPTWRSSPRSSPLRSTTAANAAGSGASTKPSSPGSNGSPTSTSTPSPPSAAATLAKLASGSYLDAGEPVVLLGDSGTGKTHLLIGLGLAACEQGRRVRYVTTAQLVNELVEAADEQHLSRVVGRYARLDLLCLDELGYVQVDPRGAELLFQIITEREERASIAIASNLPFSEWGTVSPTHAWSPPSSTGSPSTPTSSRPAPSPTDSAPARTPAAPPRPAEGESPCPTTSWTSTTPASSPSSSSSSATGPSPNTTSSTRR